MCTVSSILSFQTVEYVHCPFCGAYAWEIIRCNIFFATRRLVASCSGHATVCVTNEQGLPPEACSHRADFKCSFSRGIGCWKFYILKKIVFDFVFLAESAFFLFESALLVKLRQFGTRTKVSSTRKSFAIHVMLPRVYLVQDHFAIHHRRGMRHSRRHYRVRGIAKIVLSAMGSSRILYASDISGAKPKVTSDLHNTFFCHGVKRSNQWLKERWRK